MGEAKLSTMEAATSLASASLQASEQKSLPWGVDEPQLVQTSSLSHEESSSGVLCGSLRSRSPCGQGEQAIVGRCQPL